MLGVVDSSTVLSEKASTFGAAGTRERVMGETILGSGGGGKITLGEKLGETIEKCGGSPFGLGPWSLE
jgi:hypothetical protein